MKEIAGVRGASVGNFVDHDCISRGINPDSVAAVILAAPQVAGVDQVRSDWTPHSAYFSGKVCEISVHFGALWCIMVS